MSASNLCHFPRLKPIAEELADGEQLADFFDDAEIEFSGDRKNETINGGLMVLQGAEHRAVLIHLGDVIWSSPPNISIERRRGYVIDDCFLSGGTWSDSQFTDAAGIVLSGSLTSGGYKRGFASILAVAASSSPAG